MDSDPIIGLLHAGRVVANYARDAQQAERADEQFNEEVRQAVDHLSQAIKHRQRLLGRDVGPVFACKR